MCKRITKHCHRCNIAFFPETIIFCGKNCIPTIENIKADYRCNLCEIEFRNNAPSWG